MSSKKLIIMLALMLGGLVILLSPVNVPWAEDGTPTLLKFSDTGAELTIRFMVNDKPATTDQKWVTSDKINLSVEIKIDKSDVGQNGAFYVVINWNDTVFMMKDDQGELQPWQGDLTELVAYTTTEQLPETETIVEVISGLGGMSGKFAVFVGYQNTQTGTLIYNGDPVTFSVQSVQKVLSNSLHGTTRGMGHFYAKEQGGFEQFTHIPYEDPNLPCASCHVESTGCTTCHDVPGDSPSNDKCLDSCHKRQAFEQKFNPDVHLQDKAAGGAGLKCADCHSAKQVHGDGTPYNSLHENPNKVDCEQSGCHTNVVIAGKTMHETHHEDLDCASCHVKSTLTCYSCHFEDGSAFEPPITDWKILVKSVATGKVTTGNVQTMAAGGNTLFVAAPFFGHTIQKDSSSITCASCHNSDAVREYKEQGTMTLATWHEDSKTLSNMKGVIPIPTDWETALKMPFIAKDASGEWAFMKDTADATQMLYAAPINVKKMPKGNLE